MGSLRYQLPRIVLIGKRSLVLMSKPNIIKDLYRIFCLLNEKKIEVAIPNFEKNSIRGYLTLSFITYFITILPKSQSLRPVLLQQHLLTDLIEINFTDRFMQLKIRHCRAIIQNFMDSVSNICQFFNWCQETFIILIHQNNRSFLVEHSNQKSTEVQLNLKYSKDLFVISLISIFSKNIQII